MHSMLIPILFSCSNARGPGDTATMTAPQTEADSAAPAWSADEDEEASEGEVDESVGDGAVLINEVSHAPTEGQDWVEIFNGTSAAIDVADWAFTDDDTFGSVFTLAAYNPDTVIPAQGFLYFFTKPEDASSGFGIKSDGSETVFLLDDNGDTVDSVQPEEAIDGMSYGRIPDGEERWTNGLSPTPGAPNDR